jgi:3-carboxy-cis,cis-muconate cycloisomerase
LILFLSEHLTVDENRMRENVGAATGLMLAEALSFALTPTLGRAEAKRTVANACRIAVAEKRHVVEVLQEKVQAPLDWNQLREEMNYLGATEVFIDRLISET